MFLQILIFISLCSFDLSVGQQIISLDQVYRFNRYTLEPVHVFKNIRKNENIAITEKAKYEFRVKRDLCWDTQHQYFIILKKHLESFSHKYYNEHMIMLFDDPHCGTLSFLMQKTFGGYHNTMISLLDAGYNVQKLLHEADLDDMEINTKIERIIKTYPFHKYDEVNFFYKSWHSLVDEMVYRAIARHAITIIQNMCLLLLIKYGSKNFIYNLPILVILGLLCMIDSLVMVDCVLKVFYNGLLIPIFCFVMYMDFGSAPFYNYTKMSSMLYAGYELLFLGLLYYRCNQLAQITDDCYVYHKNKVIETEDKILNKAKIINCLLNEKIRLL